MGNKLFTNEDAQSVAERIGLRFEEHLFDAEQFRRGLEVEMEHGSADEATNVTNDDPELTGKIAWAHLNEFADYYTRLDAMETEANRDREERTS